MRYRNLFEEGAVPVRTANYNPRRHGGRLRNPDMDLGKWLKTDHVVDGALIGAGASGTSPPHSGSSHTLYAAPTALTAPTF